MDKKRIDRIVKEEVQNLFEMRPRTAAPFGYGMRGTGKPERFEKTDPYERGEGTYGERPRREEIGLTSISMIWDPTGKIGLVKNDMQAAAINRTADEKLSDPDRTQSIRQTILGKPGFRPVAELYLDLEYGKTAMDTKVQATINTDGGQDHVGTGSTAVDAIRDAEEQWRGSAGGAEMGPGPMEPMSESRWCQLAGLMTEGRKSTGEVKLFSVSAEDYSDDELNIAKEKGLDLKDKKFIGTRQQHKNFYNALAQHHKRAGGPQSFDPFDPDALDRVD